MVTRAKGRFINRPTKTGRGVYDKFFIYIPTELARDSSFPLAHGQEVEVRIDPGRHILEVQPVGDVRAAKQQPKGTRRKQEPREVKQK